MINTQYLTIDEFVTCMHHIVVGAQHHNIAMFSPWVDYILCLANIVCGVVNSCNVVAIDAIILEDKCVGSMIFS